MKKILATAGLGLALLLGGCLQIWDNNREPVLRVSVQGKVAQFRVENGNASRYVWDFGDGTTAETTIPAVTHAYTTPDLYTVVVRGYGKGAGNGSGAPGPAPIDPSALMFELSSVVDMRPPVEIVGMKIEVIDPPYWYVPGTPAWPDWHYPACVHLRFILLYKANRPGEVQIVDTTWYVTNSYGQLVGHGNGEVWIWVEAGERFLAAGCPGGPKDYHVRLVVRLSDASVVQIDQTIWACPSNGCG